jgi:transglutaminase-like putative cysteine protease
LLLGSALAQGPKDSGPAKGPAPRLGPQRTETYYVGVVVLADKGACTDVLATVPVPIDWPEQTVKVLKEAKTSHVKRLEYVLVGEGAKQMRARIPSVPEGEEASVVLTVKIDRRELLPPEDPGQLVVPEKLDPKLSGYLAPSPYIESNDGKIQSLAKEIVAGKANAWERTRAIQEWVLAHVKYEEGPIKGALAALKEGTGDAEELTSLFIALCRANKVPARMVWVPGHCYGEFYLADAEGRGHWFPCQVPGRGISEGSFGQIAEFRPILQKGDNFTVPEKLSKRQRYISEFARAKTGRPKVSFIRERVDEPTP